MLPRNLLGDTWLVFCRVMLPVVRNPVAIVFGIAQPLLYLGLFGPLVVLVVLFVLGAALGVRAALGVPARAGHPCGDPGTQRLVAPDDRVDGLSAVGTVVLCAAAHALRVGRERAQRFLLYVRTTAPLPNERTSPRVNSVTSKSEPNIGMPVPYTMG